MTSPAPIAYVCSLDSLRYAHETRPGHPLYAGSSTAGRASSARVKVSEVLFGRHADLDSKISVSMIRDDHPHPNQVSAKAGSVFSSGHRPSVWLRNLSTKHSLYVRKWPSAHTVFSLAPIRLGEKLPRAVLLGEGLWWVFTSRDSTRTPGWVMIEVLSVPVRPTQRTRGLPNESDSLDDTDPEPSTRIRGKRISLGEEHLDFLVETFIQYLAIPPEVRPVPVPANRVNPTRATSYKEAIIRAARPGVQKGRFIGMYNADLLPSLFEGVGSLTFSDVQRSLVRLGLLD